MMFRISDLIYQKRCEMCHSIVPFDSVSNVCGECHGKLFPISGEICNFCGVEKVYCGCDRINNLYGMVIAPFYYHGYVRNIIHRLKFRNEVYLAAPLARAMTEQMVRHYRKIGFDMIIPVPITRKKLRSRGYNQSILLAEHISKVTYLPISKGILIKKTDTADQHALSYHERLNNLHGSFEIADRKAIAGKTVLLCDDVKTTGATLNECAYMLKVNGAASVYAVCASLTPSLKWHVLRSAEEEYHINPKE